MLILYLSFKILFVNGDVVYIRVIINYIVWCKMGVEMLGFNIVVVIVNN